MVPAPIIIHQKNIVYYNDKVYIPIKKQAGIPSYKFWQ